MNEERANKLEKDVLLTALESFWDYGIPYDLAKEEILTNINDDFEDRKEPHLTEKEALQLTKLIDAAYGRCYDDFSPNLNTETATDVRQFFVEITDEKIFDALIRTAGWTGKNDFYETTGYEFDEVKGKFFDIRDCDALLEVFEHLTQEHIDYIIAHGTVLTEIHEEIQVFYTYGGDNRYFPRDIVEYLFEGVFA